MSKVLAAANWLMNNWAAIVAILTAISTIISTLVTALTNHPQVETWLHRIQGALSWVEHADVGGFKVILKRLTPPVKGQPVQAPPAGMVSLYLLPLLTAAALVAVLWGGRAKSQTFDCSTPVIMYGPTLVPFEEVSLGHGNAYAAALGLQASVGLCVFEAFGRAWTAFSPGVLVLGGGVPGGSPAGVLQAGVKIGTFNGLFNLSLTIDCQDSEGNGVCQHGNPHGLIGGVAVDLVGLAAILGAKTSLAARLPLGGFFF